MSYIIGCRLLIVDISLVMDEDIFNNNSGNYLLSALQPVWSDQGMYGPVGN